MTKTQFKKKIASMKKDVNQYIDKETLRLFECGGTNKESYGDDYELPKIVLCAVLKNLSFQYRPFSKAALEEVKNLEYF